MKKIVTVWILTFALLISVVGVASAVTDGEFDNGRHPYVGLMAAFNADGEYEWRCSGTLISPTIFLTAGHCTETPAASAKIWFDDDVESFSCPYVDGVGYTDCGDDYYPWGGGDSHTASNIYTHPEYYNFAWFTHDLGVVVLDEPYNMSVYGVLPQLDQLDSMKTKRGKQDVTFTSVGYGLQKSFPDAASWKDVAEKVRMVAYPHLIQINTPGFTGDFSILLSNNTATGGTCYGDSGGPNFIGKSNVIAGVTSYGLNWTCGGTGGVYRVDKADDLDWLYSEFGDQLP
jgi:secreted trypsin-like serine protease